MLSHSFSTFKSTAIFATMADLIRKYVLLTGSDLGDRKAILTEATSQINQHIGKVISCSDMLESEPWGFESDTKFLNQALLIETSKQPEEILNTILSIEEGLGRIRESKQWTSRSIDIDILCEENRTYHSENLTIPHKHLHERLFALEPLCQLVPEWIHPELNKPYIELKSDLYSFETGKIS
jgi:2-amino-4-hydroxy-6-hydroxymethyldihydropteridine diphosphokinase